MTMAKNYHWSDVTHVETAAMSLGLRVNQEKFDKLFDVVESGELAKQLAGAFADQVRGNLQSGLAPDGRPMPERRDGRPRGVRTGILASSIRARFVGRGFQVVATGLRAAQGAVLRVFYGAYKEHRGIPMQWRDKGDGKMRPMPNKAKPVAVARQIWQQGKISDALKHALKIIAGEQ